MYMQTFDLYDDCDGIVKWEAPDGKIYQLDTSKAEKGEWFFTYDENDLPVMAFKTAPSRDGELVVSLDGAKSFAATLLHNEDDTPRKLYFATDAGNNNPLKRPAFILRVSKIEGCPVAKCARFSVLCVG